MRPSPSLVQSVPALLVGLLLVFLAVAAPARSDEGAGFRLLMVESPSCVYCRVFNRDIAPIYAMTPEGRAAPLVHVRLRAPLPEGVSLAAPALVTPTFILIGPDGAERDRIIGYPGEDFFWSYLDRMFARAGVPLPARGDGDGS
jgi:hypothetical protein